MKSIDFGAEIDGTEDFFQMFWPVTVSQKSANFTLTSANCWLEMTIMLTKVIIIVLTSAFYR